MKKYLLGIDIGTSSCKICIIDEAGSFVGAVAQEYRPLSLKPGWFEQDPEEWYQAVIDCLGTLKKDSGIRLQDIAAVGTTGQMKGATFMDSRGEAVRNTILWNDLRNHCERYRTGERVLIVCMAGYKTPCRLNRIPDIRSSDHRSYGGIACTKAFGQHCYVRRYSISIESKPLAEAPPASHHLVRDQEYIIPITDRADDLEVPRGCRNASQCSSTTGSAIKPATFSGPKRLSAFSSAYAHRKPQVCSSNPNSQR